MKTQTLKKMPILQTDEQAEDFIRQADLSEYDLSDFTTANFEFEPKEATINMRLPTQLLNAIKIKAKAEGIPYTRYIRLVLEQSIIQ